MGKDESTPFVSIIIPAYNAERTIAQCVESITGQSFDDMEIIIIDDGSSDNTGNICDGLAKQIRFLEVFHTENRGVAHARNLGIRKASGEYMWFIDADDFIADNALTVLSSYAKNSNVDCILFDSVRFYADGREVCSPMFCGEFETNQSKDIEDIQKFFLYPFSSKLYNSKISTGYVAPWSKFIRRDVITRNAIVFDERLNNLYEDGMFTLELFDYVHSVGYISRALYWYRFDSQSLIHVYSPDLFKKRDRAFRKISSWLIKTDKDESYKNVFYCHVVSYFGGLLTRYYFHPESKISRKEAITSIKSTLNEDFYSDVFENVKLSSLKSKDKFLAICGKHRIGTGFCFYCNAKRVFGK